MGAFVIVSRVSTHHTFSLTLSQYTSTSCRSSRRMVFLKEEWTVFTRNGRTADCEPPALRVTLRISGRQASYKQHRLMFPFTISTSDGPEGRIYTLCTE